MIAGLAGDKQHSMALQSLAEAMNPEYEFSGFADHVPISLGVAGTVPPQARIAARFDNNGR